VPAAIADPISASVPPLTRRNRPKAESETAHAAATIVIFDPWPNPSNSNSGRIQLYLGHGAHRTMVRTTALTSGLTGRGEAMLTPVITAIESPTRSLNIVAAISC